MMIYDCGFDKSMISFFKVELIINRIFYALSNTQCVAPELFCPISFFISYDIGQNNSAVIAVSHVMAGFIPPIKESMCHKSFRFDFLFTFMYR